MKNSFKIAAIALVMASFVACKGKSTTTTDSVKTDSVKTDSTVKVDTAKKDTTKKDTAKKM